MTYLVERLAELRRHLDHLRQLAPRIPDRNLTRDPRFSAEMVGELEGLPGFGNVVIHEYVTLDLDHLVEAVDRLDSIDAFIETVRRIEQERTDSP